MLGSAAARTVVEGVPGAAAWENLVVSAEVVAVVASFLSPEEGLLLKGKSFVLGAGSTKEFGSVSVPNTGSVDGTASKAGNSTNSPS